MIIIIVLLFILFLIWTYNMVKNNLGNIDNRVYNLVKITDNFTKLFKNITNLASSKFLVLVSLLILIVLKNKIFAIAIICALLFNSLLIGLVKNIFKRERPNENRLVNEKGYSYVSGHTMCAVSFYGFIIVLVLLSSLLLTIKILFVTFLVILILLIGFSRIYLGVHYFSDVIGALFLGISYIILYSYIVHFVLNII